MASFLPTCPLLFLNWSVFEGWKGLVRTVLAKKSGFLPIYFSKVGRRKPLRHKGLRVFCPLSHFFFTLKREKKVKKINKVENKSGLLARAIFGTQNSGKFLRPFSEAVSDTRFVVDGKIAPFQADCGVV